MSQDLDAIVAPYSTILCDIWGVIHDGAEVFPGVADRLLAWKQAGKTIILVTNAPRPASTIRRDLDRLGLPRAAYDAITSGGEAGIAALTDLSRHVGFLGTEDDRADLVSHNVRIVERGFTELACTGLDEYRPDPEQYRPQLAAWAGQGVLFHCLNPDRIVVHCGVREACAGALADIYEEYGGTVAWYGKPHPPIYTHALALAGQPPRAAVLAIGDGLVTDMLGAAREGIDAIFIANGIHGGAPVPLDFAAQHSLGTWRPVATLAGLA